MSHLYHNGIFPRLEGFEFPNTEYLDEALSRNQEERALLVRELQDLQEDIQSLQARRLLWQDHTPNFMMLLLKRQVLSKFDRLLDDWNIYTDLRDIRMCETMLADDLSIQQAMQQRNYHEYIADKIREAYVISKREWSGEFRSHFILLTLQQMASDRLVGIVYE